MVTYGGELWYHRIWCENCAITCMCDLSPCEKGNTRIVKLLGGLNDEKIRRYNNSPPYVRARWMRRPIPLLISLMLFQHITGNQCDISCSHLVSKKCIHLAISTQKQQDHHLDTWLGFELQNEQERSLASPRLKFIHAHHSLFYWCTVIANSTPDSSPICMSTSVICSSPGTFNSQTCMICFSWHCATCTLTPTHKDPDQFYPQDGRMVIDSTPCWVDSKEI